MWWSEVEGGKGGGGWEVGESEIQPATLCCCSSELIQEEVYGLSCILRRLTASFSVEQFGTVDSSQLVALIQVVTQLTCLCARKTVEEEEVRGCMLSGVCLSKPLGVTYYEVELVKTPL